MTDAVPDNVHIAELRAEAADLRVKLAAATQAEADAKSAASKLEEELESARQDKLLMLGGLAQLATDLRHAYANLSETQKRCTDLLNQVREYRQRGLFLPSWTCSVCRCFNGEAKEALLVCRSCGAPAPEGTKLLMLGGLAQLATDLRHAYANLSETQKRCTDLLNQSKEPDDREKRLLKEAAEKANNALFGSMPIDVEHLISSHPEDMPRALRQACAAIEAAMVPLQEIIQARLEVG